MEYATWLTGLIRFERLLFELDYEVMDVTSQFFLINNIKSHKRIFSPFALLITSSRPLFIIKAMLGEKERFYIFAQQISGNRACIYVSDFGHKCYNIRKTLSSSGGTQKIQVGGLGWDKGRFKVLYITNRNISFTLPPSL